MSRLCKDDFRLLMDIVTYALENCPMLKDDRLRLNIIWFKLRRIFLTV